MSGLIRNPELALHLGLALAPDMGAHEPCPRCDGRDLWPEVSLSGDPYGIYCASCNWLGPRASAPDDGPDDAWAAWDREARQVRQARALGLTVNLVQPKVHPDE